MSSRKWDFDSSGGGAERFPLPYFSVDKQSRKLGRGCAQRLHRRTAKLDRCNESVYALNYLSGVSSALPVRPSTARDRVVERISDAVRSFGAPEQSGESQEATYAALLRSKSSYFEGPMGPAFFDHSKLSLPATAGGCKLLDVLPDDLRCDVENFCEKLFLPAEELAAKRLALGSPTVCGPTS